MHTTLSSSQSECAELTTTLAKEKERATASLETAERRYESLRTEMRECLRKEQEYEDMLTTLRNDKSHLQSLIRDYENSPDTTSLQQSLQQSRNEVESLQLQLAAFQGENDQLLVERMSFKKDMEEIASTKAALEKSFKEQAALQSTLDAMVSQQAALEKEVAQKEVQLKNAQEDLSFAQLCVSNLQASLAVYTSQSSHANEMAPSSSRNDNDEKNQNVDNDGHTEKNQNGGNKNADVNTPTPTPCSTCTALTAELASLQDRVAVMDTELQKLRGVARDAQQAAKQEGEKGILERRQLRQLLVTYLTSVRGGAALRTLMEKLVC